MKTDWMFWVVLSVVVALVLLVEWYRYRSDRKPYTYEWVLSKDRGVRRMYFVDRDNGYVAATLSESPTNGTVFASVSVSRAGRGRGGSHHYINMDAAMKAVEEELK